MSVYSKIDSFYTHSANLGNKLIDLTTPIVKKLFPIFVKYSGILLKSIIDLLFKIYFVWIPKAFVWCSILFAKVMWKATVILSKIAWKVSVFLVVILFKLFCGYLLFWAKAVCSNSGSHGDTPRTEKSSTPSPTKSVKKDSPIVYTATWRGQTVTLLNSKTNSLIRSIKVSGDIINAFVGGVGEEAILSVVQRDGSGRTFTSTYHAHNGRVIFSRIKS